jgi:hypothetical protein
VSARETDHRFVWPLRVGAVMLGLIGVLPMANLVTDGPGLPWYGEAVKIWLLWGGGLAVGTTIVCLGAPSLLERVTRGLDRALLRPPTRVFVGIVAAGVCGLSLYFGWRLLGLDVVAGDEFAQRWQARLLAAGRLSARTERPWEAFNTSETLTVDGRWFSQFPIGGPAILALGVLVRAPWLVNPLLAALAVAAIYRFVSITMDERSARWTAVLCGLSPYLLFMSGSEMNHVPTLAASWVALATLASWAKTDDERHRRGAAIVIGIAMGIGASIRPYDAALLALALGVFQLHAAVKTPVMRRSLAIQALAGALPVILLLGANWATTGHPFVFGYDVLHGAEHRPGFHVTPSGFEHTPRRGLYAISAYLLKANMVLLGWPIPAVLLSVAALAILRRGTRWDVLLLVVLGVTLLGYWAYWGESYFLGPRFLFTVAPILLIYAARLPWAVRDRLERPALRSSAIAVPVVWLVAAWTLPANVDRMFGTATLASTAVLPKSASRAVAQSIDAWYFDSALVFVPESWHGRLTARLRAVGIRPLQAEELVKAFDACTLQQALDASEGMPNPARGQAVETAVLRDPPAARAAGMIPVDQLAFVSDRPLSPRCTAEFQSARDTGITLAEMLPYESLDRSGALGGRVVYARDLGPLNERLRARFGARRWLVVRVQPSSTGPVVSVAPYEPAPRDAPPPSDRSAPR